ncbi:MAG: GGDEF domain-containing protein [Eubacteriales bacterium]|nr:GGDEF domain-containing protein [Eubacteriales bacterium]
MEISRGTRSHVVGVLIGDVSNDFIDELMAGISDAGEKAKMQIVFLLGMQKYSEEYEAGTGRVAAISHNSVYDYAMLTGADAFIIACGSLSSFSSGGLDPKFLACFADVPYVVLQERIAPDKGKKTYIVVDNYHSFNQCIEHLIVSHGRKKIVLVSGPRGHADARERLAAYTDCMRRYDLPVTEGMIAYGDYSEYVDELVCKLIDDNPGLDAIAFANDEMAKAGYRECHRRGLVVGRDIAITGFDNFNAGRTMEPPLTTVSQNTYQMGQLAIGHVEALLNNQDAPPLEMRTEFLVRHSCGCTREGFCFPSCSTSDPAAFIDAIIDKLVNSYTEHFAMDKRNQHSTALRNFFHSLREIAVNTPEEPLDYNDLASRLDTLFTSFDQPTLLLSQCLQDFLLQFLGVDGFPPAMKKFAVVIAYMQQYIHVREIHLFNSRLDTYRSQSWIAPEVTSGLFSDASEENVFRCVVKRLVRSGLRNVYLCLLENPVRRNGASSLDIIHRMRLAAYADVENTVTYPRSEMPVINEAYPFWQMPGFSRIRAAMAFSLFSGDHQYGILLCDEDHAKSTLLHVIGLQLGMLIDFLALRGQEKKISAELENIREKNEILNFLSEYDSLCGLLNRRGFIEQAIRRNRDNISKVAYCAFMDLDYLKQINDTFGHSEGDAALMGVSMILKNIAGENDLIGRIGGDEFVGLFITDDPDFDTHFLQRFQAEAERYNLNAEKPYWLDVSIGLAHYVCRQGLEVSSVLAAADQYLYAAKRNRSAVCLRRK